MSRTQFNIRLSDGQKERWTQYVEESHEYDTLTDLVRVSVERNIAEGGLGGSEDGGSMPERRLDDMSQSVEQLAHEVKRMGAEISSASEAMYSASIETDLGPDVYRTIPTDDAITEVEVAEALDISESKARVALEQLYNSTTTVKKTAEDSTGTVRWSRSE